MTGGGGGGGGGDDDSSAPPSLATSSGSDDEEEDRARFEEPEESEETENATRRTNPRTNSERAAPKSRRNLPLPPRLPRSRPRWRRRRTRPGRRRRGRRAALPRTGPGTRETREPALTSRPPRRSTAWSIRARRHELKKSPPPRSRKKSRLLRATSRNPRLLIRTRDGTRRRRRR